MYKDLETSVAVATALLFTLFVFIISTDRLGAQEQGVRIGVAVTAGSSSTLVNEVETPIGRNVNFVRRYQKFNTQIDRL